ncbi:MAG: hypothetical protein ACE5LC_06510 [Candidatus Aminicenantales bacterium]
MAKLSSIFTIFVLSSLLTTSTKDIERAFLQNKAGMLYPLLSSSTLLTVSFPQPIAFSDQISRQQAFFLLKKIFSTYSTFEFYSEIEPPLFLAGNNFIFKARWSFMNRKNKDQYVFHIYFYLRNENPHLRNRASPQSARAKKSKTGKRWKITEIRAERI